MSGGCDAARSDALPWGATPALHAASTTTEILAACRAFEGATWSDVEAAWSILIDAARRRGDAARRDNSAPSALVRFTIARGLAALEDVLVARCPEALESSAREIEHAVQRHARGCDPSEAAIALVRRLVADGGFAAASTAFRR